jgi:TPP-dependent trihydroxycyclohexane-1,2-dione (THcHDO) dehydratase
MMRRLTTAQAIIRFLKAQRVARDEEEHIFFTGCFGIFGHGNVAGIGQALQEDPDFPYYLCRNEQAMVHTAAAFAKMSNRLRALACTTSIGPGATDPSREVYVLVGDGSYLMMAQEIATSLQEKVKLNIVLLDNRGFSSIGGIKSSLRQWWVWYSVSIPGWETAR